MEEILVKAFQALSSALETLHEANIKYLQEQRKFDIYEAETISKGVEGKNQAERDANLKLETEDGISYVNAAYDKRIEAQLKYDLAKIEVDCLKHQVRLLELESPKAD